MTRVPSGGGTLQLAHVRWPAWPRLSLALRVHRCAARLESPNKVNARVARTATATEQYVQRGEGVDAERLVRGSNERSNAVHEDEPIIGRFGRLSGAGAGADFRTANEMDRRRARAMKLVAQELAAVAEYAATEATGLRVLASAVDLLNRLRLLDGAARAGAGGGDARRLLGPVSQFYGVAELATDRHREELRRAVANMGIVTAALRDAQSAVATASRAVRDELDAAVPRSGSAGGTSADAYAACTPEDPAALVDFAACADALQVCVARDLLLKMVTAAAACAAVRGAVRATPCPGDGDGGDSDVDAAAEVAALLRQWPSPLASALLDTADDGDAPVMDHSTAADRREAAAGWRRAAELVWRVTGRGLPVLGTGREANE